MINLDDMLSQLGDVPVHPGLAAMDTAVMAGLAAHQSSNGAGLGAGTLRPASVAAIAALLIGVASAGLSGSPAVAASSLTPFGPTSALAPSTLLLASR